MARDTTVIGRGTVVRARVTGAGDLEVQGRVEGEITVDGEVSVAAEGMVGASVSARRIVVRGAVRGDLVAEEGVHLEDGARVVGDVRSTRVSIAPGALLRGFVQTGAAGKAAPRASREAARPAPAVKPAAKPAPVAKPAPPAKPAAKAPPPPAKKAPPAPPSAPAKKSPPLALAGARPKAPPPVVPVLKKGAKGALKKRA